MRVLLTRPLPESVMRNARARFDTTQRAAQTPMTEAEAARALETYDAIICTIGDRFNAAAFSGPIRTRLLANFGVGYNHIDVAAAKSAGLQISNTPDVVTDATADIALTLMLMTARRAGEGERCVRRAEWTGWNPTQLLGRHITGKRLGIVGFGRIGQAIAARAHFGFDMQIGYVARAPKTPNMPATAFTELRALMGWADIVAIAVPGGPETHHLITAPLLEALGPNGILVNVARGDVVDETALIDALQSGTIAGAGLDVYEQEPHVPEALRRLENATLLPHLGTATLEVREKMGQLALANVIAMAEGAPLPSAI